MMEPAKQRQDQVTTRTNAAGIVLFDGVCNLCNRYVRFLIDRDPAGYFRFASLQSPIAHELLESHTLPSDQLTSIVYIENGRAYTRSDAVLRMAAHLPAAWRLLSIFRIVPRVIRDAVYDFIARKRYRWFGKRDECALPTPGQRQRFLDN